MDFVKGQLVRSKAGRDKTRTLAVLAVEEQMLLLADGDLRKLDNPKRKKKQHVAPTTTRRRTDGTLQGGNQLV